MSDAFPSGRHAVAPLLQATVLAAALAGLACAKVGSGQPTGGRDGGGVDTPAGAPRGGSGGSNGSAGAAGTGGPILPDASVEGTPCVPSVTCTPPNGRYCGVIGNGCFGTIDCGTCPTGQICEAGLCVGGADCVPLACQVTAGQYCGKVGNGCGRAMDCGTCAAGQTCSASGLCVADELRAPHLQRRRPRVFAASSGTAAAGCSTAGPARRPRPAAGAASPACAAIPTASRGAARPRAAAGTAARSATAAAARSTAAPPAPGA